MTLTKDIKCDELIKTSTGRITGLAYCRKEAKRLRAKGNVVEVVLSGSKEDTVCRVVITQLAE